MWRCGALQEGCEGASSCQLLSSNCSLTPQLAGTGGPGYSAGAGGWPAPRVLQLYLTPVACPPSTLRCQRAGRAFCHQLCMRSPSRPTPTCRHPAGFPIRVPPLELPGYSTRTAQGMQGVDFECGVSIQPGACVVPSAMDGAMICSFIPECRSVVVFTNGARAGVVCGWMGRSREDVAAASMRGRSCQTQANLPQDGEPPAALWMCAPRGDAAHAGAGAAPAYCSHPNRHGWLLGAGAGCAEAQQPDALQLIRVAGCVHTGKRARCSAGEVARRR